jgi:hypothetical protein
MKVPWAGYLSTSRNVNSDIAAFDWAPGNSLSVARLRGRIFSPGYYTIWIDRTNNAIALVPDKGAGPKQSAETTAVTTRLSSVMPRGRYVFEREEDGRLICLLHHTR